MAVRSEIGSRRELLHPFATALFFGLAGFVMLPYLTAIKLGGAGIGNRPLLFVGILAVGFVVQLFSLGLVGELLTSQREEKAAAGDTACAYVRDVLS